MTHKTIGGYNILLTGVSGLLGNNMAFYLRKNNQVSGTYNTHPVAIPGVRTFDLDLVEYPAVRSLVRQIRPNLVIHCASRVDVDVIEEEKDEGWQANVIATRVLLDALRDIEAKFVHISTDSVYSGEDGQIKEDMAPAPCNWYGKTKLASESLVIGRAKSLILRTNIYGWNIQNKRSLAEWFLIRLQDNHQTMGFSDARFSSIYTFLLAEIIAKCILHGLEGIYNCGCRDSWSKSEFGQRIAERFDLNPNLIFPVSIDQSGLKARRAKDLSLSVDRLENDLEEPLPTMFESLNRFYADWKRDIPGQIKRCLSEDLNGIRT